MGWIRGENLYVQCLVSVRFRTWVFIYRPCLIFLGSVYDHEGQKCCQICIERPVLQHLGEGAVGTSAVIETQCQLLPCL